MIRKAECSCGKLSALCVGEPIRLSICHCHACQRRTGTVFGTQARFQSRDVSISGPSTLYSRTGESGHKISFHFCPDCGSTVYYQFEGNDEFVIIPTGGFGDENFPAPNISVYNNRKHSWVALPKMVSED